MTLTRTREQRAIIAEADAIKRAERQAQGRARKADKRERDRALAESTAPNKRYPSPHDTVEMEGRFWTVTGNFMGGQGQESVYGLAVDGARHDATAYGEDVRELFVPAVMLNRLIADGRATLHPTVEG